MDSDRYQEIVKEWQESACSDFRPESGRCADRDRCQSCGAFEATHVIQELLKMIEDWRKVEYER